MKQGVKSCLLVLGLCLCASVMQAQWRVGLMVGGDNNHYVIDKQYMVDWQFKDRLGLTAGILGQYDINNWLGVRAELNWIQKNYRRYRSTGDVRNTDYTVRNDYLQLPVMASFSFGGSRLRGFLNLGVYGGYWLMSWEKGTWFNVLSSITYEFSQKVAFDSERDQRLDCGFLSGIGAEYRFARHWAAQLEGRYYYSVTSVQKDYMHYSDPRYNNTVALQVAIFYLF